MSHPAHPPWFYDPSNIKWTVTITYDLKLSRLVYTSKSSLAISRVDVQLVSIPTSPDDGDGNSSWNVGQQLTLTWPIAWEDFIERRMSLCNFVRHLSLPVSWVEMLWRCRALRLSTHAIKEQSLCLVCWFAITTLAALFYRPAIRITGQLTNYHKNCRVHRCLRWNFRKCITPGTLY
jgi:hypothetical protein